MTFYSAMSPVQSDKANLNQPASSFENDMEMNGAGITKSERPPNPEGGSSSPFGK